MKYLSLLLLLVSCGSEVKSDLPPGKVRLLVNDQILNRGSLDEIMLPLTWWVNLADDEEKYMRDLQRFSKDQRFVYATRAYIKVAAEQGHYQFFNSTNKMVWADALEGAKSFGLNEHAQILERAINKMKTGKLEDADFEDEDVDLLNLNEKEDPGKFILEYVRSHRKKFYYEEIVTKP